MRSPRLSSHHRQSSPGQIKSDNTENKYEQFGWRPNCKWSGTFLLHMSTQNTSFSHSYPHFLCLSTFITFTDQWMGKLGSVSCPTCRLKTSGIKPPTLYMTFSTSSYLQQAIVRLSSDQYCRSDSCELWKDRRTAWAHLYFGWMGYKWTTMNKISIY